MDSVVYPRLKKFAYGSIANFFILRIYLDFIAILILEIASGLIRFVWLDLLEFGAFLIFVGCLLVGSC